MCGISGAFGFASKGGRVDRTRVERITGLQAHRGPDGHGIFESADGRLVLGHRRLSIIDTNDRSLQPFTDLTGRWTISFNGEIYNYADLRAELQARGFSFRTSSDTEVLLTVIAAWGAQGIARLRGMFAFALWDEQEQELWLARDPFGIKPLYYGLSEGQLWFASEARALATAAPVDPSRDPAGLVGFYLWGHVPEPFTWWSGISSLAPGRVWRVCLDEPLSEPIVVDAVESVYQADPIPLSPKRLRDALLESVANHLVADVDVGIFLSAGVDSTVVACLAAELGIRPKTITVAFDDYRGKATDEAPLAEETARSIGADHHTVRLSREQVEAILENFFERMDLPTIDGLNTYLASYAARSVGLKVALSGLGADELFGGYPSFTEIPSLLRVGTQLRMFGAAPVKASASLLNWAAAFSRRKKLQGLVPYSTSVGRAYTLRRSLHLREELPYLLDESWLEAGLGRLEDAQDRSAALFPHRSMRSQISALELSWYMRNQLLRDSDWAGMAHSLEIRVPFVDRVLFSIVAPAVGSSQPPTKLDLIRSLTSFPTNVSRRKKTGFTTPIGSWGAKSSRPSLRDWASEVHRAFTRVAA
jgi:asparagine synthase (glutamine-hydrolysing)